MDLAQSIFMLAIALMAVALGIIAPFLRELP